MYTLTKNRAPDSPVVSMCRGSSRSSMSVFMDLSVLFSTDRNRMQLLIETAAHSESTSNYSGSGPVCVSTLNHAITQITPATGVSQVVLGITHYQSNELRENISRIT